MRPNILLPFLLALLCFAPEFGRAQAPKQTPKQAPKPKPGKATATAKPTAPAYPPVHILGMRPGITMDSVKKVMTLIDAKWREVPLDTISRSYGDKSVKVFVLDSVYVRFGYMRMAFVFDQQTDRLRRISITPRLSSILAGRNDDLTEILLLYFGQTWGKPDIQLDLTPAYYKWSRGNTEVKGYIRRGFPLWVLEG
jgi:hypothetical protein